MRNLGTILRRELAGLFLSPLAWTLAFVVVLLDGVVLLHAFDRESGGDVDHALGLVLGGGLPFWLLCALLAPLITMRMLSEESRSGVLEFLLTAPVGDPAVVLGKALAATAFFALLWGSVWLYGLLAAALGAAPDWGILFTSWLGATLVCGLFVSVGLAASALTDVPLMAAFLASVVDLSFFFGPRLAAGLRARSELAERVFAKLDAPAAYMSSFRTGALDTAHVVFFLAWSVAFLFLAVRLVESRRWL